jgi:hypothetical protein
MLSSLGGDCERNSFNAALLQPHGKKKIKKIKKFFDPPSLP